MSNGHITGRSAKILSRFPTFMRTEKPGKVIAEIGRTLGNDLDEAERRMAGIQRSHRLAVADEERDVLQLAALLGLQRADFLILRRFYEKGFFGLKVENPSSDQDREEKGYAAYLSELKESVQRIVRVMLEGCGTLWALLEGTAILINADTLIDPGKGRMEHLDKDLPRGGFIHRIRVNYSVIEDGKPVEKGGFLYMVENPIVDKATEDKERRQREWFRVKRGGFFEGPVAVQVAGVANRTALPMVINKATHEGVGFRGVLTDGQKLVFATDGKGYLDGAEVTDRCYYFRGGLVADATKPAPASDTTFDGVDPKDRYCLPQPVGALDRNYPRPAIGPLPKVPVPTLPLGESDWRFSVQEGAFDASGFHEVVYALPGDPKALGALPSSGKVQLTWEEHEPFAVTILVPADLKSLETSVLEGEDLRKLVRAGLERFRAAGIRLDVDYFDEKWILGKSLIRDMEVKAGVGVDFEGTVLSDLPV